MEKKTCINRILEVMQSFPKKEWLVSDFAKLIGYEAGTRIGDLCRSGLAYRSGWKIVYNKDGTYKNRYALYSLK